MLPKVGTTIGGKYTLEAVIGRGGMGAVYRAKNVLTGRRVALKWILPTLNGADEMRSRLLREARAMGRIEHPNVCAVYDVGEDGEAIYLVMELLSGRTLRAMMDERRLEVAEIAQILLSAMQGVSAAHRAGVVHRDLKPDNLFVCDVDDGGRSLTKVLDFGVSKILDLTESDGLTKSGMAVGTPHYMSPEQIIGSKDVDARSDVYALGTILYQALTRRLPFDGENYSALVVQIATGSPEPLEKHATDEGAALAPIVHKAIARQPADRYPDVVELAHAIEPFAGGVRFETPRPRPRSEPPPPGAGGEPMAPSVELPSDRALAETRDGRPAARASTSATLPARGYVAVEEPAGNGLGERSAEAAPRPAGRVQRGWLLAAALAAMATVAILARMTMATSDDLPTAGRAQLVEAPPARHADEDTAGRREEVSHAVGAALSLTPGEEPRAQLPTTSTPPSSEPAATTDATLAEREAEDRAAPRSGSRRHPRVVEIIEAPPPAEQSGVMTATGRSGTISTTDFE